MLWNVAAALLLTLPISGLAATQSQSANFSFNHAGAVDSGPISVLGTFSKTSKAAPPALVFAKFDVSLGTLTGVSVTTTTTTSNFAISPSGALSLISSASAVRSLAFTVTSGAATGGASNSVSTSGASMLTLLGLGSAEIGGAPLANTTSFSTAADLTQFSGSGTVGVGLLSTDVLTVSTTLSLFNGAGFGGSGSYAGSVTVLYTYQANTFVRGRVFLDDGIGSGTANDGILNGGETGVAGRTLRLLDASDAVLDTTVSSPDGSYRLVAPSTVPNGSVLRVLEVNTPTWLSTGASAGNSGGTYSRGTDAITWTYTSGPAYTGLNFGDIPAPALTGDSRATALPGSVVAHRHRFTATSTAQVVFSAAHSSAPAIAGWSETIYIDANQNGTLDPGEVPLGTSAVAVTAGQAVFLIVQVFVPENAPTGARVLGTISAVSTFVNASPTLTSTSTISELTEVTLASGANLSVVKSVDKANASPGAALVYAIVFTNTGVATITNLVINDATPPYTTFVSASVGTTPAALGTAVSAVPSVGFGGTLRWTFPGQLAPTRTGTVTFTVTINP